MKFYGKLCHEERKPRKSVFDISNKRILFNVFVRIVRVIMLKVVGKLFIILTILSFIVLTFDEDLSYLNRGYIRNLIWAVVAFTMITLEVFFELFMQRCHVSLSTKNLGLAGFKVFLYLAIY